MTTRAPAVPTIVTPAHLKTMHALSSYQSSCQLMQRQETVTTTHLIFILIMSFIATTTISDPRSSETNTCLEPMFLTETYSQARQSEQQHIEQRTSITNAIRKSSLFDPKKDASSQTSKQTKTERAECDREAGGIWEDLRQYGAVVFDQTESIWWIESEFHFSLENLFETQTHQTNLLEESVIWCVLDQWEAFPLSTIR